MDKGLQHIVTGAISAIGEYADEKITIHKYSHYDGPSGIRVTLADGRLVYEESDWGGWSVNEFHPGAWCDYIMPIAENARQHTAAYRAAEKAKEQSDEEAKWAPVDDKVIFATASDDPNPKRFYKWIVEVEVNEVWVADGFNLRAEMIQDGLMGFLSFANAGEIKAKMIHAPTNASIAKAQGFESVERWEAANAASRS